MIQGAGRSPDDAPKAMVPQRRARRVWPIVAGIASFALLMSLRHELSSVGARAVVAGLAGAALGSGALASRRPPSPAS